MPWKPRILELFQLETAAAEEEEEEEEEEQEATEANVELDLCHFSRFAP
jgi:hypothetical protein